MKNKNNPIKTIKDMTDKECVKEYTILLDSDLPISKRIIEIVIKERGINLSKYPEYFV